MPEVTSLRNHANGYIEPNLPDAEDVKNVCYLIVNCVLENCMSSLEHLSNEYMSEWPARPKHVDCLVKDARSILRGSKADWEWCRKSLKHPRKRWFVASIFAKAPVPKSLLPLMIEAAIEVENPSTNRQFIEPCIRSLGALHVLKALRKTLERGSVTEQTGVVDALYWVNSNPRNEDLADERASLRQSMIRLFLETDFVPLQRSIISKLEPIPGTVEPLFEQVMAKARNHEDEYLRHRVEIQAGLSVGPFQMLPPRNR